MSSSILIPVALLEAASRTAFKVDEDLEGSVNDIFQFGKVIIENGHIVSTNRHMLFCSKLENVPSDFYMSIPLANVESFLTKVRNYDTYYFEISVNADTSIAVMEMKYHVGAYEAFKYEKDEEKLAWKNVLIKKPTKEIKGYPIFQTKYLQILDEIAMDLGGVIGKKELYPIGLDKAAYVEFSYSEYPDAFAVIMPLKMDDSKTKYAVCIEDITGEEPEEIFPAESGEIAFKAVQRLKKDMAGKGNFRSRVTSIRAVAWNGTEQEHKEKMFYTKDWLNQPLRRYDDPQKAIEYMTDYDEIVECYDSKSSITTRSVDEVNKFFGIEVSN